MAGEYQIPHRVCNGKRAGHAAEYPSTRCSRFTLITSSGTAPRLRVSIVRALFIHRGRKKIREPIEWVVRNVSGACIQTRQLQQCKDTQTESRIDAEACRRSGVRSVMVLPLVNGDNCLRSSRFFRHCRTLLARAILTVCRLWRTESLRGKNRTRTRRHRDHKNRCNRDLL